VKRGDVVLVALQGDDGQPRPAVIRQSDLITAEESTASSSAQ
jgi:mRNA-degrading endonuclease toxin of MazEF toxin-antitoxin module